MEWDAAGMSPIPHEPGGFTAASRWLRSNATTPPVMTELGSPSRPMLTTPLPASVSFVSFCSKFPPPSLREQFSLRQALCRSHGRHAVCGHPFIRFTASPSISPLHQ